MEKTYVITEIVGVSSTSISDAIHNAVNRASKTLKALGWFEVKQVRGSIEDGKVGEFHVTLDVGFRYLTDDEMRRWIDG
jgi:flavin-binding protein dodecin